MSDKDLFLCEQLSIEPMRHPVGTIFFLEDVDPAPLLFEAPLIALIPYGDYMIEVYYAGNGNIDSIKWDRAISLFTLSQVKVEF